MARKIVQDDRELLQVSQMELTKLQRQYRTMENDKNSYFCEIKCYISKQRKIIDTLSNEKNNLVSRILSKRPVSAPELNNQWRKEFGELLKIREKYLCQIKQKKDTIAKLVKKIRDLEGKTKVLNFYNEGKTMLMDENVGKSMKQIELLQNKLYNETVKYDKILAENSSMRQELDALLKDRATFNNHYKKLVMKLNADKKKLLAMIEKATAACDQRDEADEKLKQTLNRDQQETIAQKHKIRELHRQLDHLIQLKEFVSIKTQKRILVDLEKRKSEKKREKVQSIENFAKKHQDILEQIKEFCNEQNAEKLPAIFLKQEEENFAFFNYVNEINNEVEALQDEVKLLSTLLDEQKTQNAYFRKEQTESLDCFKKELQSKKNLIEEEKESLASTEHILKITFVEMENILSLFKYANPTLIDLLGENRISSENVELFLDIMEKKVADFVKG